MDNWKKAAIGVGLLGLGALTFWAGADYQRFNTAWEACKAKGGHGLMSPDEKCFRREMIP